MAAELGLGTVQFGVDYGVSNRSGKTSDYDVKNILKLAREKGIRYLDTAALYGDSEEVLGRQNLSGFKIITKTPRFAVKEIQREHVDDLIRVFQRSLSYLNTESVYGLLSHHVDDLLAPGGDALWEAMLDLKSNGKAIKIGASVYDGSQIDKLLERYSLDLIQLPINVLDQRLILGGQLDRLKERNVEIHARSVFLQGLLLMNKDEVPEFFMPIRTILEKWWKAIEAKNISPAMAALAFVRDLPQIDAVIVGVNNVSQLEETLSFFSEKIQFDAEGLHCSESLYLNPANWRIL